MGGGGESATLSEECSLLGGGELPEPPCCDGQVGRGWVLQLGTFSGPCCGCDPRLGLLCPAGEDTGGDGSASGGGCGL